MAELINPEEGLGGLLNVCDRRFKEGYFGVILVIVALAMGCDRLWKVGGDLLFPYRRRR